MKFCHLSRPFIKHLFYLMSVSHELWYYTDKIYIKSLFKCFYTVDACVCHFMSKFKKDVDFSIRLTFRQLNWWFLNSDNIHLSLFYYNSLLLNNADIMQWHVPFISFNNIILTVNDNERPLFIRFAMQIKTFWKLNWNELVKT